LPTGAAGGAGPTDPNIDTGPGDPAVAAITPITDQLRIPAGSTAAGVTADPKCGDTTGPAGSAIPAVAE
jgi:hypothetical protein